MAVVVVSQQAINTLFYGNGDANRHKVAGFLVRT
jgi:hypothetical protein